MQAPSPHAHFVEFYDDSHNLLRKVHEFMNAGLEEGAAAIVIATPEHRFGFERLLSPPTRSLSRLFLLDAQETLHKFMLDGRPDPRLFHETIGQVMEAARFAGNGQVKAFGEMVALLWAEGKAESAIRLEELWNELSKRYDFSLFCAYPLRSFAKAEDNERFQRVCAEHSHVHPVEGFSLPASDDELHRLIASLQQRTSALEAEVKRRAAVERELAQLNARKDEFLAILGHELRNPMASIGNAIAIMAHSKQDPEVLELARKVVDRQFTQLNRLVDDLLDVSRVTTGKLQLRLEPVSVEDLIHQAVEEVRPLIDAKRHTFDSTLALHSVRMVADAGRLTQAIANLLTNAAKYTPPGGKIALHASGLPHELTIVVTDNGCGLDTGTRERLFELFGQGRNGSAEGGGGLGVGLALCKTIVQLHGGRLDAQSEGDGKGSRFTLTLPLQHPPKAIA